MNPPTGLVAIVDHDRELRDIVRRLAAEHGSVSLEVVASTVDQAYEDLGAGTVQNFRIVLTERRARRLLSETSQVPVMRRNSLDSEKPIMTAPGERPLSSPEPSSLRTPGWRPPASRPLPGATTA